MARLQGKGSQPRACVSGPWPYAALARGRGRRCMLGGMWCRWVGLALVILFQSRAAMADVTLPALVSDGMVLQERAQVRVWGWAPDGEQVKVTLRGQSATAKAQGGWWAV